MIGDIDDIETPDSLLREFSEEKDPCSLTAFFIYRKNGGMLSIDEFYKVMSYKPTEDEILKNKWRGYSDIDLILFLKVYHVKGDALHPMTDPFIRCEVLALNGELSGILATRSCGQ